MQSYLMSLCEMYREYQIITCINQFHKLLICYSCTSRYSCARHVTNFVIIRVDYETYTERKRVLASCRRRAETIALDRRVSIDPPNPSHRL